MGSGGIITISLPTVVYSEFLFSLFFSSFFFKEGLLIVVFAVAMFTVPLPPEKTREAIACSLVSES